MTFDPATLAGKLLWLRAKDLSPAPVVSVATASSFYSGEPPSNAFDGNTGTNWDTNGTSTGWLQAQLSAAYAVTSYKITRREGFVARMPKSWTFLGSNDGSTWTTLDTQTNQTWPSAGTLTFSFSNATAYLYYRLNVTANNGDAYLSAEMAFTGVAAYGASSTALTSWTDQSGAGVSVGISGSITLGFETTKISAVTASEYYYSEPPANAIDGNASTSWTTNGSALPQWLRVQMPSAIGIGAYSITRRDDIPGRNVKDFQFQGSNDGTNWTTLDTRSGVTWPTPGQTQTFNLAATSAAYLYYRVYITANNGDGYTSIAELQLSRTPNPPKTAVSNLGSISLTGLSTAGTVREAWFVVTGVLAHSGSAWALGSSGGTNYVYDDGKVYDGAFVNYRQIFTPTLDTTLTRIVRIVADNTNWTFYIDNVQQATVALPTSLGASAALASGWLGRMGEVLIRNQVSSPADVANMTAYLNAEHGLSVAGGAVAAAPFSGWGIGI